jgi:hypothetical protein
LEETFERWPREVLLEDTVRVVRRFKPQVIVAVFPADERAGHGQHQAAGVIAGEAYETAGDPERLTGLPETPWMPAALYRRAWTWRGEEGTHGYSLAGLEPISGRSLGQLAAASRSFHRSQDMGREQLAGPAQGGLIRIAGGGEGEGPFAGIGTGLEAIAELLPPGGSRDAVAGLLARTGRNARQARAQLTPTAIGSAVPRLAEILDQLRQAESELVALGDQAQAARELVGEKIEIAGYALAAAAGVVTEAVAESETVAAGGELEVESSVWAATETSVTVTAVDLLTDLDWQIERRPVEQAEAEAVRRQRFRVAVPDSAQATVPYFLARPRDGDLYTWSATPSVLGEPLEPPPLRVRFDLVIADRPLTLVREVVYRYADQAFGERRLPVRVVPPVEVSLEPGQLLLPDGAEATRLSVTVRSNLPGAVDGRLEVSGDGAEVAGERAVVHRALRFSGEGDSETVRLVFDSPAASGRYRVEAAAQAAGGRSESRRLRRISYPHIRPLVVPVAARSELSRFALTLPSLERVGYVRGASDRVPEVLSAVGVPVELLGADELERGELDGFDAIVIGSRAYETDAALRRANDRLLEYARGGGLLLVQYQQYQFVRGGFAPWPLEIGRPHGRVTDETAEMSTLVPKHPVFSYPNRITGDDWLGWVQERGLYFPDGWDERYLPLLEMADPGRDAERGALLVASVGKGTYVYTGLSFFRQLPAGVPGAIRLFVNLLSLGE